jgi:hypothetical protein
MASDIKISIEPPKAEKDTKADKVIDGATGKTKYVYDREQYRQPQRRIVSPRPAVSTESIEVHETPDIQKMVENGLSIISMELAQYKAKASKGKNLDLREARVVNSYIETLAKIAREAREAQKPELLQNLTDEQLLQLVSDSLNKKNVNQPDPIGKTDSLPDTDGDLK